MGPMTQKIAQKMFQCLICDRDSQKSVYKNVQCNCALLSQPTEVLEQIFVCLLFFKPAHALPLPHLKY